MCKKWTHSTSQSKCVTNDPKERINRLLANAESRKLIGCCYGEDCDGLETFVLWGSIYGQIRTLNQNPLDLSSWDPNCITATIFFSKMKMQYLNYGRLWWISKYVTLLMNIGNTCQSNSAFLYLSSINQSELELRIGRLKLKEVHAYCTSQDRKNAEKIPCIFQVPTGPFLDTLQTGHIDFKICLQGHYFSRINVGILLKYRNMQHLRF